MADIFNNTELFLPTSLEGASARQIEELGLIEGMRVRLEDGIEFLITIIDCAHLEKAITQQNNSRNAYFAKPGLIVVSRANDWINSLAVCWAKRQEYFVRLSAWPYPKNSSSVDSIAFPDGDIQEILSEATTRGYIENIKVVLDNGKCYSIAFFECIRVNREIEIDCVNGRPFFVEPGLIVVDTVSLDVIRGATSELAAEGYFDHLKPDML
jgi:hypothetical protein